MKFATSTPEKNNGQKLTIPARVISTLDAYKMYTQGHIIDRMAGYYSQAGVLEPNFFMMDKVQRLQALNRYKDQVRELGSRQKELELKVNEQRANEEKQRRAEYFQQLKEEFQESLKTT